MKILYKMVNNPSELLDKEHVLEELHLPDEILEILQKDLAKSNEILPPGAQALQDWLVALLDRFDPTKSDEILPVKESKSGSPIEKGGSMNGAEHIHITKLPSRNRQNSNNGSERHPTRSRLISSNITITKPAP
jgi:hypothetical protein